MDLGPAKLAEVVEIPLTQGQVALVDAADYELVSHLKWCALKGPRTFYAVNRKGPRKPHKSLTYMHRLIMPSVKSIDHINRIGTDNRRCNLRPATQHQNNGNLRKTRGGLRFKGVSKHTMVDRWVARLAHQHIGSYLTEEEAARAYDRAAIKYFGAEFAATNEKLGLFANHAPLGAHSLSAVAEKLGTEVRWG